ncbi:hypothetical protein AeRB84_010976 [Aphanomyces euteiches]|nr:hypothetical protein AeRB84_010976 [Aphanomyces euteiches]
MRFKRLAVLAVAAGSVLATNLSSTTLCSPSTSKCVLLNSDSLSFVNQSQLSLDDSSAQTGVVGQAISYSKAATASLVAQVDSVRGYTQDWFHVSLKMMAIWACTSTLSAQDKQRCAPLGDPLAVMNGSQCLAVAGVGNCSSLGLCERQPNCYWPPPVDDRQPYFTGDMAAAATTWTNSGYVGTFVPYMIPGLFLALVTFVSTITFVILRCGFDGCYGSAPFKYGYSKCNKVAPAIIFVASSLVVVVVTAIAFTQNQTMSEGIVGAFQAMDITFANLNVMTQNVDGPLASIKQNLNTSVESIRQDLGTTTWVSSNFTMLSQVTTQWTASLQALGPFPSGSLCRTLPQSLNQWLAQLVTIRQSVDSSISTMRSSVASAEASISNSLQSASLLVDYVQLKAASSQTSLHSAWTTFKKIAKYRIEVILAIFILGLAVAFFGLIALCAGYRSNSSRWIKVMHVSWGLGAWVAFVGFIISSAMLVIAILGNDGCHYVLEIQKNVELIWPGQLAKVLDSCYAGQNPLNALDLSNDLSFSCSLPASLSNASQGTTALSSFQSFVAQMNGFSTASFGLSDSSTASLIAQAARSTPGLNATNIRTPWTIYGQSSAGSSCTNATTAPTCFMNGKCTTSACYADYVKAYSTVLATDQIVVKLRELKSDLAAASPIVHSSSWPSSLTSIQDVATQYTTALNSLSKGPIQRLQNGPMGSLLLDIDRVKCSMDCSWLVGATDLLYTSICTNLVGSTLSISLCVFLLCFFLLPMIVTAILLEKRLRGVPKAKLPF